MLFQILLICHSLLRWLILAGLLYTSGKALLNLITGIQPTRFQIRLAKLTQHWILLATVIGVLLYLNSPLVHDYLHHKNGSQNTRESSFFGWMHPLAMLMLPLITSGAMFIIKTSRTNDYTQYILMRYFGVAFMLAAVSIPWPVFDLVHRPLLRI
ncbi:hypothetical protein MTO98_15770 [Mucilaginibacter sp. SMC90]|uniref:hypothetical protein n=1 Tax=Mucilaginibacter sp. SMC90 TaxID=2929803 RepID=UPI001FB28A58|nr:hypothetical protein [Mucilaginibacter sp. SMC90]UOE52534.1 hypothetical protein MTO98_15770 [Mucilaginibacter sp. SMC90]